MPDVLVRPIATGDVPSVIALFRASFSPDLMPLMIYGQHGIDAFILNSSPREGLAPQREMLVATDLGGERVLGFADFDVRTVDTPHLAYICVDPGARRRGIASKLIDGFLASRPGARSLSLDVFESNAGARHLYDKLGFAETGERTVWFERQLPSAAVRGNIIVSDFIGAVAAHSMYGFSMTTVAHGPNSHKVGRLGNEVLRFGEVAEFADDELLSALRRVFPSARTALLISTEKPSGKLSTPVRQILLSIRMCSTRMPKGHRHS